MTGTELWHDRINQQVKAVFIGRTNILMNPALFSDDELHDGGLCDGPFIKFPLPPVVLLAPTHALKKFLIARVTHFEVFDPLVSVTEHGEDFFAVSIAEIAIFFENLSDQLFLVVEYDFPKFVLR